MRRGPARLFVLLSTTFVLSSCDRKPPLAPDDDPLLSGTSGSSFNLTSNAASHSQIDIAWKDVSSSETGYELWRSTTGPGGTFTALTTTTRNVTNYSDGGLTSRLRRFLEVISGAGQPAVAPRLGAAAPPRPQMALLR